MVGMSDSALRSLLGLTRLSFRFDPETARWVKPARSFTRKEIESETGLSSQGARNGLAELAEAGLVSIDSSGRSYEYTLEISVPTARYTYVPTAFLEAASALSGTELRLVLTVLRATWGWTTSSDSSRSDSSKGKSVEHRRWARLSLSELAHRTGRSETAIKEAATQLQGRFLERLRPTGGAYYYRFLPEAVRPDTSSIEDNSGKSSSEEKSAGVAPEPSHVRVKKRAEARIRLSLFGGIANDLAMGRQKSDPPYAYREFILEKKAKQGAREEKSSGEGASSEKSEGAMLGNPSSPSKNKRRGKSRASSQRGPSRQQKSHSSRPGNSNRAGTNPTDIDLSGFSERLQGLGETLMNAGVRPRCVPALLTRFSAGRIEANLQLYRRRAPAVQKPGAWLYAAITQGFALPSQETAQKEIGTEEAPSGRSSDTNQDGDSSFLPEPGEKVSETLRRELIREGLAREEDFDKFSDYDDPDRKQHFFQLEKAESQTGR
jgi:hypothetical protein